MSINRVTLLGNVGGDPKVYTFENGGETVSLSLATSTPKPKTAAPPPPQPTAAPKGVINRTQPAAPQQTDQWNGTVPPNKEEDDLPF